MQTIRLKQESILEKLELSDHVRQLAESAAWLARHAHILVISSKMACMNPLQANTKLVREDLTNRIKDADQFYAEHAELDSDLATEIDRQSNGFDHGEWSAPSAILAAKKLFLKIRADLDSALRFARNERFSPNEHLPADAFPDADSATWQPLKTLMSCRLSKYDSMPAIELIENAILREVKSCDHVPMVAAEANHTPDFRSVQWFGTSYSFTQKQAIVVQMLWRSWSSGHSETNKALTQHLAKSKHIVVFVREAFRQKVAGESVMHPAWGAMIVKKGRDAYTLQRPEKVSNS